MVVFGPHVENQSLAYSEEEGGKLTLHEEGEELECFPEDNTKIKKHSGDLKIESKELNYIDPQEHPQQASFPSEIKDQSYLQDVDHIPNSLLGYNLS